jgi:hypothetical protein
MGALSQAVATDRCLDVVIGYPRPLTIREQLHGRSDRQ